jgi:hypothetical protein
VTHSCCTEELHWVIDVGLLSENHHKISLIACEIFFY